MQERKERVVWSKICEERRGKDAQCTYGGFGFRKEHRLFTQEGRQMTCEQMKAGSRGLVGLVEILP